MVQVIAQLAPIELHDLAVHITIGITNDPDKCSCPVARNTPSSCSLPRNSAPGLRFFAGSR